MSIGITRPNGSVYRPRKIRTQLLGNEDETNAVVVLGTHDLADARVRAQAEVKKLNSGIDYQFFIRPSDRGKRVWYRQKLWGFHEDSPLYGFEVDEERGVAGVEFDIITEFDLDDACLDEFDAPEANRGSGDGLS
ncbi:hypothetical protein [Microbacterium sp. UBA837]|uniref:hypothetical protein n=1 Tax=Microbacterium sp. UBA837 TaxID=1946956 RepID=UPI0025DFB80F|nr:hypothetical protein [Microbacterium sp. UBA837]